MENENKVQFRFTQWLNESLSLKLAVIFVLTLILLIPAALINDLVREREIRQEEVIQEISQSWAGSQTIGGPVLMVPYSKKVLIVRNGVEQYEDQNHYLYLLPEKLTVLAETGNQELSRGIFKVSVYEGKIHLKGNFGALNLSIEELNSDQIHWSKANVVVGISDLRGVKQLTRVEIGGSPQQLDEYATVRPFTQNLIFSPILTQPWDELSFAIEMDIRGTAKLNFLQLAKETEVTVTGNWTAPKFTGQYLPENREVSKDGYDVHWKLAHFARSLPQQWAGQDVVIVFKEFGNPIESVPMKTTTPLASSMSAVQEVDGFGIEFIQPVNHYQKSNRATKYAILVIALSFLAMFFTEIIAKRRVHIVQYVLIGMAMVVFYTLLLAFSEHIGFNAAYGVAALATIMLITLFIRQIIGQRKAARLFAGLLVLFYSFVFVIIQLNDYALLLGSVGLFFCVGALMYFSSKINWQGR